MSYVAFFIIWCKEWNNSEIAIDYDESGVELTDCYKLKTVWSSSLSLSDNNIIHIETKYIDSISCSPYKTWCIYTLIMYRINLKNTCK